MPISRATCRMRSSLHPQALANREVEAGKMKRVQRSDRGRKGFQSSLQDVGNQFQDGQVGKELAGL